MMRDRKPAGTKHGFNIIPKDRAAAKGASPKEQEQRRLAKRLQKLKKGGK